MDIYKVAQELVLAAEDIIAADKKPKSVYDKTGMFGWSSPADKDAKPWRVSHKGDVEKHLKKISGVKDIVVDYHPRVGGYEVMWVGVSDNRDSKKAQERVEELAKLLKSKKYKVKVEKHALLLIDDIKRDVVRKGASYFNTKQLINALREKGIAENDLLMKSVNILRAFEKEQGKYGAMKAPEAEKFLNNQWKSKGFKDKNVLKALVRITMGHIAGWVDIKNLARMLRSSSSKQADVASELLKIAKDLTAKDSESNSEDISLLDTATSKLKGLTKDFNGVYVVINRMHNKEIRRSLEKSLGRARSAFDQFKDELDRATMKL